MRNIGNLAAGDGLPEILHRQLGELVRLVHYHRIGTGQQFGKPRFLQHHIGQQQVVIDHDDIRLLRLAPGFHDKAVIENRAFAAQAIFGG